jgi:hypothetical protein
MQGVTSNLERKAKTRCSNRQKNKNTGFRDRNEVGEGLNAGHQICVREEEGLLDDEHKCVYSIISKLLPSHPHTQAAGDRSIPPASQDSLLVACAVQLFK